MIMIRFYQSEEEVVQVLDYIEHLLTSDQLCGERIPRPFGAMMFAQNKWWVVNFHRGWWQVVPQAGDTVDVFLGQSPAYAENDGGGGGLFHGLNRGNAFIPTLTERALLLLALLTSVVKGVHLSDSLAERVDRIAKQLIQFCTSRGFDFQNVHLYCLQCERIGAINALALGSGGEILAARVDGEWWTLEGVCLDAPPRESLVIEVP